MRCHLKPSSLSILLASLLLFLVPFSLPSDTSENLITISENDLNLLKSNLLKLSLLSQTLELQVKSLKNDSEKLLHQLDELKKKQSDLEKQITDLESALLDWKDQYEESLILSRELREQLGNLQTSYDILSQSFNQYRDSVNKEITKLKAEKLALSITSGVSGTICIVLGVLYLIEKITN